MYRILFLTIFHCCFITVSLAQSTHFTGQVVDLTRAQSIGYVNIGLMNTEFGTVSDGRGNWSLSIPDSLLPAQLQFSFIGFRDTSVVLTRDKANDPMRIVLASSAVALPTAEVSSSSLKRKQLGLFKSKSMMSAGYGENKLGYEVGLRMKSKRKALLDSVHVNFCQCDYDSIFYRVNVYQFEEDGSLTPLMKKPVYIRADSADAAGTLSVSLWDQQIEVEGDFLVSLEHLKDLGEGNLFFCSGLKGRSYYQLTSFDRWKKLPIGISIAAEVLSE